MNDFTRTTLGAMLAVGLGWAANAGATELYFNGFETDISGWDAFSAGFHPTRVASGTNGVTSATDDFHAESTGGTTDASGSAGNWGGYNFGAGNAVPTVFQPYRTSAAIFLDVGGGWANDTRFDYSSAINNSAGTFLRDFVFNVGFYDSGDMTGPGAGTNRFIVTASNNAGRANSFPKNPGRGPIGIDMSGWYTFEHYFYDNGGVLNVDLSIFDSGNTLVNSWTLGTDPIAGVGGNRYGWFARNEFSVLAFDDTRLETVAAAVPEPGSLALFTLTLAGFASTRRSRG